MRWSLRKAVVAKAINAKPVVVATKVDTITAKAILVQVRMVAVKAVAVTARWCLQGWSRSPQRQYTHFRI